MLPGDFCPQIFEIALRSRDRDDFCAGRGKALGAGTADAATGAGDQCNTAFELSSHR